MPQIVECPACAKRLKAPDQLAGHRVKCPACKATVEIPSLEKSSSHKAGPAKTTSSGESTAVRIVQCPSCERKLKIPVELAGRSVACPACKTSLRIPAPSSTPLATELARAPLPSESSRQNVPDNAPRVSSQSTAVKTAPRSSLGSKSKEKKSTLPQRPAGSRPRLLYFLFALTLVPLALQTFVSNEDDLEQRLIRTVSGKPDLGPQLEAAESDEEFFGLLPGGRVEGAHLPRETWMHWFYALLATAFFLALVFLLFERGHSSLSHLLLMVAVTSTVGIISLLMFQWLAEVSQGVWVHGRGIIVLLFYVVKFIGFSYHSALNPENGFWQSFMGFTFGVGLCEELTKLLPTLGLIATKGKANWRAACVLGLASGIGFGVAEGIMYSASYYNGLMTGDIYLTRFFSCVSLHAVWAASAAVLAALRWQSFDTSEVSDQIVNILIVLGVPAILHGLYDTLLKRDMPGYALVTAVASFIWLIILVERARSTDEVPSSGKLKMSHA